MSMNPRTTTDKIREDYQEYISSILEVKDNEITRQAYKAVHDSEFVKGPYLETTMPFVDGKSLKELAEEGLISKEFEKMGNNVHYSDWKLRIHQENALRHIIEQDRNMVVSTGTGSGKTECYLYPIFNELMREKESGTLDDGVRALLIFPMNALANDQQKKLRKLLKDYPDITFGRYTGETEYKLKSETIDQAEERMHKEYDLAHINDSEEVYRHSIQNEYMSRDKMINNPPHILLTNYAMLEYLLLRPDTAPFFDNSSARNWRFIVIDEAHTYKGANGTEIAYLLRRLKERIRHNMNGEFRCIATSATLGSEDGKDGLAQFAQKLFDEPFSAEDVITTRRKNRVLPSDARLFMPEDYKKLKNTAIRMAEAEKGKFLFEELSKDIRLFRVYDSLRSKPKRIEEVAGTVFDDLPGFEAERTLIDLIEMSSEAKKSEFESALLPARYHLFVKSLEGLFTQYYPNKKVYLDRRELVWDENGSHAVFELANCKKCEQEYLVGAIKYLSDGYGYLSHNSDLDNSDFYFVYNGSEDELDDMDEDDSLDENIQVNELEKYHLCLNCGRITPFSEKKIFNCCECADEKKIVSVYKLKRSGKNGEANSCPCCGSTRKGLIGRFLTANQPATFAIAKSLYEAIPPRPGMVKNEKKSNDLFDDIFGDDEGADSYVPESLANESGRKLLIFSDNRQEAAFFAGFLEKKYNLIMWRKLILECLKEAENNSLNINDLIKRVRNKADKTGIYTMDQERAANLTDDQKLDLAASYVMQEFINPELETSLEGLGYIEIYPETMPIKETVELCGLKGGDVWKLFRYIMDTLRQKGAISFPENLRATDDFFSPRNHAGYFRQSDGELKREGHVYGFMPKDGKTNKRLAIIKKLNESEDKQPDRVYQQSREDLYKVYQYLLRLIPKRYIIELSGSNNGTLYQINYAKWNFRYVKTNEILYRCKKCGKVFDYSVSGFCSEMKCEGALEEVKAGDVRNKPYYNKLFDDSKFIPMVAKEHTAQLSRKAAGLYQKDFEEGKINVLSCSTTFEMGVDVGELEATFLRNVPPETANYIQRAGRAGRRTSSTAFAVTFSRRTSHDLTFYQNPAQIIAGKIAPPVLEIENEKIALRHMYSMIISWFFKRERFYFENNAKAIVAYGQDENMATRLKAALDTHPQELQDSIHAVFSDYICDELKVDNWEFVSELVGDDGTLSKGIQERLADLEGLHKYLEEVSLALTNDIDNKTRKNRGRAYAAEDLIRTLNSESSINFLASKSVLPKYGFPVDTVSLDVIGGSEEEAGRIDLSRDLKMAISEYAPPAQVVANGKVWESYAINTVLNKGWPAYIYYSCHTCGRIYPPQGGMVDATIDIKEESKILCETCGEILTPRLFIIPIFGFSTQMEYKPKPVGDSKPSTYYNTQTQFWGISGLSERQKAEAEDQIMRFDGRSVKLTYSPGGKLFALNQGRNGSGLFVCPECGYSKSPSDVKKTNKHLTKFKKPCSCNKLIHTSLGHVFSTDVLKISLPEHILEMENQPNMHRKDKAYSILYAILEGASKALDISRDDINGCVIGNMELVLFDDTAGGSGYVKNIYHNFPKVLREARNKVAGGCGCTPETSCYGCLRNYTNQSYHDRISRGFALEYLEWLINGVERAEVRTSNPDICTQFEDMRDEADDENVKAGWMLLLKSLKPCTYEAPSAEETISSEGKLLWPELIWKKSKVIITTSEEEEDYNALRKEGWNIYSIDSEFDAEELLGRVELL